MGGIEVFNPAARITRLAIPGLEASVYVVDELLAEPQRWVELAAQHLDGFALTGHNAYPGPELRMPDGIAEALDGWLRAELREAFGVRRTLRVYARLAMVTLPPEQLAPRQWICHRDRMGMAPEERALASVLYLFADERLGGTSFYRPLQPMAQIEALIEDSARMDAAEFAARHGWTPGYPGASNACFERVLTVPPRFNRAIFYDGSLFHCSDIPEPTRLSADPRRGRLTLNGFWVCRRAAR